VTEQPHVLIVGGLLSPPVAYRRMRRRLLDRGAASVDVAPVRVIDWARAGLVGFGPLQAKVVRSIQGTWDHGGRQPILVVGHSGGGLLARLAMCDAPYQGRVGGAAPMVGCLVTLGSPHDLHHAPLKGTHEGVRLAAFLAEHPLAAEPDGGPAVVTVASDAVPPWSPEQRSPSHGPLDRLRRGFFVRITGPTVAPGSDGIVSSSLAHVVGARQLTLHETYHGVIGAPWYGDAEVVDRWWPLAVRAWREAADR
jgi:pimeloyl-ACP methyl ester carboxylesterase